LIRIYPLSIAFKRQTSIGINKQKIIFRKIYVSPEGALSRTSLLAFTIGRKKYSTGGQIAEECLSKNGIRIDHY
jgi:hypothetical protein